MKKILEKMQEYSGLASWAIWESSNKDNQFLTEKDLKEDISFEKYEEKLQKSNSIILAMNPGGVFNKEKAYKISRKCKPEGRKWSNFHNIGRSRDYLLAAAIMGSKLEGSYMTDIFPFSGSNSEEITKFVGLKENRELIKKLIKEFDEEISLLLEDKTIRLFCLGRQTEKWANKFLVSFKKTFGEKLNKSYEVIYLPHYSGANRNVSNKKDSHNYYPKVIEEILNK